MAQILVGNLPDSAGNIEEQRTIGSHVSVDGYASIYILSTFYSQNGVPKALRIAPEPCAECRQVSVPDARNQSQ